MRDKSGTPIGSVWQPYRWLIGAPLDEYAFDWGPNSMWREINDFTDDLDSVEHAERFRRLWAMRRIKQGPATLKAARARERA